MATAAGLLAAHPWITRRKLDVAEYHRMAVAGILHEDDRVELIEGELVEMAPIGSPHSGTVNSLTRLLVRVAGDRAVVSVQNPIRLGDHSEPEPDFTLLRPRVDDYRLRTPVAADVLLLIEVADSSLRYDRTVKLPLYARHGVAEVWIVDLERRTVEVYREPAGDSYGAVSREEAGAVLEPALLPGVAIPVADVLGQL
jgi:Uma2 family endonuclease